ncbi:MAG: SEC-C domain-containing protein [Phycisphaerales bacterium]|nr:SEC-C domain-containing protein [Phycisphaerales bacterium]
MPGELWTGGSRCGGRAGPLVGNDRRCRCRQLCPCGSGQEWKHGRRLGERQNRRRG